MVILSRQFDIGLLPKLGHDNLSRDGNQSTGDFKSPGFSLKKSELLRRFRMDGITLEDHMNKLKDRSSFMYEYFQAILYPGDSYFEMSEIEVIETLYNYLVLKYFKHHLTYSIYDLAPFQDDYTFIDVNSYIHPLDHVHFKTFEDIKYYSDIIKLVSLISHYSFQTEIDNGLWSADALDDCGYKGYETT